MRNKKIPPARETRDKIALVKLKAEQIKLRSLEQSLRVKADRKQQLINNKQDSALQAIDQLKTGLLMGKINELRKKLNMVVEENSKLRAAQR